MNNPWHFLVTCLAAGLIGYALAQTPETPTLPEGWRISYGHNPDGTRIDPPQVWLITPSGAQGYGPGEVIVHHGTWRDEVEAIRWARCVAPIWASGPPSEARLARERTCDDPAVLNGSRRD